MILRRLIADALFLRGISLLEARRARFALPPLSLASLLQPKSAPYARIAAFAAWDAGKHDKAKRLAGRALALDPRLDDMRQLLSKITLPGPDYLDVLAGIHRELRPRTYLEIGVSRGDSIRLVQPGTVALGVDPAATSAAPLPPGVRIFAETSDEFFARDDVSTQLGGLPIDLAFIDGMHHFEFALRDFMNIERLCARESTVLIHDCYPCDDVSARRDRSTVFWTGDVWRVVILLKKYRPDLSIRTIATPPSGLCAVRNLDPSSRVIQDSLDRICKEFMALDFAFLDNDRASKLNLLPNNWENIRGFLAAGKAPSRVSL